MEKIKKKISSGALPVVLFTVFLDVLGVGILLPVLPQLIFTIFEPAGYSLSGSLIMLGWLTGIYPLMQFLATPIMGQLSDRYGRKPLLAISLAGTAFGYVLFAIGILTKNIPLLFFARAFDGVTGGNVSVARAVIADVSNVKNRTRNFGLMGAAFGLGFVIGPYLGARLASPNLSFYGLFNTPGWFDTATPFWFTAILSLINMVLVLIILPETHAHINHTAKIVWTKALDNIRKAAGAPGLRVIFSSEFLFWGGFSFFTTFFQIFLIEKLNFTQSNIGDFFAYIGILMAVTQAVLVPILAKRLKNHQVLRFSFLGLSAALFLQLIPSNTSQLLLLSLFIPLFVGLTIANAVTLISLSAAKEIQGEVLGIEASVQALAQSVPAIVAGYVATLGIKAPVIVAGSVVLLGGIVYNLFYRPSSHVLHEEEAAASH